MMESEVKIYDSNINLRSVEVDNINPVIDLPFNTVEMATSQFAEVKDKCDMRFTKKRKFRRVKSAGIF
ncbi:MAG: hypothetical protein WA584_06445 [Pyrinomonadaceae bacterium]